MIFSFRQRIAGKFGFLEHWAGRLTGIMLFVGYIRQIDLETCVAWSFAFWCVYFVSHNFEKLFYGRNGFRRNF